MYIEDVQKWSRFLILQKMLNWSENLFFRAVLQINCKDRIFN